MLFMSLLFNFGVTNQIAYGQTLPSSEVSRSVAEIIRDAHKIRGITRNDGDKALAKKLADEIKADLAKPVTLPGQKPSTVADFMKSRYPGFFSGANKAVENATKYSKGQILSCEERGFSPEEMEGPTEPISKADLQYVKDPYIRCYLGMSFAKPSYHVLQSAVTGEPFFYTPDDSGMVVQNGERDGASGVYVYTGNEEFLFVDPKKFNESCKEKAERRQTVFFKFKGKYCQIDKYPDYGIEPTNYAACLELKPLGFPEKCSLSLDSETHKIDALANKTRFEGVTEMIRRRKDHFVVDQEIYRGNLLGGRNCSPKQKFRDSFTEVGRPNPLNAIEDLKVCADIPDEKIKKLVNEQVKEIQALVPLEEQHRGSDTGAI